MRSRLLWRRSTTAAGLYASVGLGILGTIVAARVLGLHDFGLFVTALAAASFFQLLLDLTVEETLTKIGFRYVVQEDWGRLRRLFARCVQLKIAGGVLAAVFVALLAPFADSIFDADGLFWPVLVSALLPIAAAVEGVGLAALLLKRRYDVRGSYQALSGTFRLAGITLGSLIGVTAAVGGIVLAQAAASTVAVILGLSVFRRFPHAPQRALGDDRRLVVSFVLRSSAATGVISLRQTLAPLLLGVVAGPTQVGLLRVAQSPQTGFQAASAPVRLILLTEQTHDWERGEEQTVLAGVRQFMVVASGLMLVAVPLFMIAMPFLVRVFFGEQYEGAVDAARIVLVAAALQLVLGWTKSFPVSIGRPGLRVVAHGVEALVLLPLTVVLGSEWGVTGAAVAVLVSVAAFAVTWAVLLARLRADLRRRRVEQVPREATVT
jgi:O-antigen/teichoic acid export membrane protein